MITVGLVGFGYVGEIYARLLSQNSGVVFSWICDASSKRLASAKRKYVVSTTDDFLKVVADPDVDAVIIATPFSTHFRIAKAALKWGKHILVEKPFVAKARQAGNLVRDAKKARKIVMVGHTMLFHPYFQKLEQLIRRGELGRLRFVLSTRLNLGPVRPDASALWDLAPHDLSMILEITKALPYEVFATSAGYLQEGIADVASLNLKFRNQVQANIVVSWLSPVKQRQFMAVGSKKMAVLDDVSLEQKLTVYDQRVQSAPPSGSSFRAFEKFYGIHRGNQTIIQLPSAEPIGEQLEHFLLCISRRTKPLSDGRTGMKVVRILETLERSLKENRPVRLRNG